MAARKKSGSIVKVASHGDRTVTMNDVLEKEPTAEVAVPVTEIDTLESITLGFRQDMFTLADKDGNGLTVMTTGGFGGTSLILEWKDGEETRKAMMDSVELGIRWVETFDEKNGKRLREAAGR